MFPDLDLDTLATEINASVEEEGSAGTGRVFLMEFSGKKATVVMENGRPKEASTTSEKVRMYAQMMLRTAYEKYSVYEDTGFGMTYYNYLGNRSMPSGFLNSEMKREIGAGLKSLSAVDSICLLYTSPSPRD